MSNIARSVKSLCPKELQMVVENANFFYVQETRAFLCRLAQVFSEQKMY